MPNYIFSNEQGRIYRKEHSISSHLVDEHIIPDWDRALLVDENTFNSITKYHIVDNGKVREMTLQEKSALDQAELAERTQKEQERINALDLTTKELINVLIKKGIISAKDITDNTAPVVTP